ncbi:MAG: hypothetical protein NVSMB6_18280 [Burkholderiaceae bacterium]
MKSRRQLLIDSMQAFWSERELRERRMLGIAGAVVAATLVYLLAIGPAYIGARKLKDDLPQLRQQASSLQALAREAREMAGNAPPPALLSTRESVEAVLARKGLKAQSVIVTGDLVRVQLNNVSFAAVLEWLDDMQKNARLSVVESSFTAQSQTDIVNATLSLQQPKINETP